VFSNEELSTFTCPSPSTGRDTTISVIGSFDNPIKSWYPSGRIEKMCIEVNENGVLTEWYSKDGQVLEKGYFLKGEYIKID